MSSISADITGDEQVAVRLQNLPNSVRSSLKKAMNEAVIDLRGYVADNKLSGQLLKVRTGTLRRSITQRVTDDTSSVIGIVGTNVAYAAIHEYGGQIKTRLGTGKGKPKKNGKAYITMPEKRFLRGSLVDKTESIKERLAIAISEATHGNS